MKSTADDSNVKLEDDDRNTIKETVDEKIQWMDDNTTASKEEYDDVLKETQNKLNPIMSKMYGGDDNQSQSAPDPTSAPNFNPGGSCASEFMNQSSPGTGPGTGPGPKIEEVD